MLSTLPVGIIKHCIAKAGARPLVISYKRLFSSLNIEPHALRERKLRPEIDRVGGAAHIGLPRVGAGLATTAGFLFAAKGTADLGSRGPMFTLAMPQSEPIVETNLSASRTSRVKMEEVRPAPTALCIRIASSSSE